MKDGGSAFPVLERREGFGYHNRECGMTLRDYFAGQAFAGYCANPNMMSLGIDMQVGTNSQDETILGIIAGLSYSAADAMLTQRGKA